MLFGNVLLLFANKTVNTLIKGYMQHRSDALPFYHDIPRKRQKLALNINKTIISPFHSLNVNDEDNLHQPNGSSDRWCK